MRLECSGLNFTYPGSEIPVINNLSFSMKNHGFKALFGPSGVGKTSLAFSRISTPSSTRIILNGCRAGQVPDLT